MYGGEHVVVAAIAFAYEEIFLLSFNTCQYTSGNQHAYHLWLLALSSLSEGVLFEE